MAARHAWLVMLLGILSTTQTHLAKALQRQGIETLHLLEARLRRTGTAADTAVPRPAVYVLGLVLNHTTFLYHLFVAPLGGTTALYTSMFGVGLVALLLYSTRVMKEEISRAELMGAVAILFGTLTIGIESIGRPALSMSSMDLGRMLWAVGLLLAAGSAVLLAGRHSASPQVIGLTFGLCAGTCGTLDPFLKSAGQTAGGGRFAPGTPAGWAVLVFSFLVGEVAVVVTQWAFLRHARANLLVPAYNCSYVVLPVLLQAWLLPGYAVHGSTVLALACITLGFVLMRARGAPDPGAELGRASRR